MALFVVLRMLLYVNDEVRTTGVTVNDKLWHHIALTWTNHHGMWQMFVDGLLVESGISFRAAYLISGILLLTTSYY